MHKSVCLKTTKSSPSDEKLGRAAKTIRPATHTPGAASPEPTTSGYLRWMNIWHDAYRRGLIGKGPKNILILGPGMRGFANGVHCPQMAEALLLWDGSHFTVLDSNTDVLDAVRSIDHEVSTIYISEAFKQNGGIHPIRDIQKRLTTDTKPINTVETLEFRMGRDKLPKDFQPVDIAIATLSLFYPMKDLAGTGDGNREKKIQLLGDSLCAVKPGGIMYVDEDLILGLLATPKDLKDKHLRKLLSPENINVLKEQIKDILYLDVDFIPVPQVQGLETLQGFPMVNQPSDEQGVATQAQTQNAYAIVVQARPS